MPRRPRVHLDGVPLHIVQRGHYRQACFFAEEDYHCYLHWLGAARGEFGVRPACLRADDQPCAPAIDAEESRGALRLIISLGRRYVPYINRS